MNEKNDYEEYDSLKDVVEFQNNMFNPGHYIGTGKVKPTVSAPGNAMPLAVVYFLAAVGFIVFGLFLFFGDAVSSGIFKSDLANKIICLIIMLAISGFLSLLGFRYFKKGKKYYNAKKIMDSEEADEKPKLWQRACSQCGKYYDIDFPKCPYCKNENKSNL